MSKATDDVLAERQRQMDVEGWTTEHDDSHEDGQLSRAATCYADNASFHLSHFTGVPEAEYKRQSGSIPESWPWGNGWWKPKSPRKDLVRAAALIIAEIERLDRND